MNANRITLSTSTCARNRARDGARSTAARAALSQQSENERRSVEALRLDAGRRELREEVLDGRRRGEGRGGGRRGHRRGRAASRAGAAVRALAFVCVLVRRLLAAGVAVVLMAPVLLAAGVLVVPERHALARRDRRHALQRDCKRQQRCGENAEKSSTHQSGNCTPASWTALRTREFPLIDWRTGQVHPGSGIPAARRRGSGGPGARAPRPSPAARRSSCAALRRASAPASSPRGSAGGGRATGQAVRGCPRWRSRGRAPGG